jgi:hypothetical protein
LRYPKAQQLAFSLVFLAALGVLLVFGFEGNRVALAGIAISLALIMVWLARTVRKEGWRGDKRSEK